jgi:hypothetical protein
MYGGSMPYRHLQQIDSARQAAQVYSNGHHYVLVAMAFKICRIAFVNVSPTVDIKKHYAKLLGKVYKEQHREVSNGGFGGDIQALGQSR